MKYLVIVGGGISGIGKGILASSCGVLLKSLGYNITIIKIDPYLNIDAGLMNPNEHGEVFVLNDGSEVDLDLGNYERFLDIDLTSKNNITTGKIYKNVINEERKGKYLGKTVQVIPHVTDEIQNWILSLINDNNNHNNNYNNYDSNNYDNNYDNNSVNNNVDNNVNNNVNNDVNNDNGFCIIELGGTIGDIESAPFIEALRQFKKKVGIYNFGLIQVTLVPDISEQKSKPTQSSIKELRMLGLIPDIIACRCVKPLKDEIKDKINHFCDIPISNILSFHNCKSIYDVPNLLKSQNLINVFKNIYNINDVKINDYLFRWDTMAKQYNNPSIDSEITIAIVGKYTNTSDSYFSIIKALEHASAFTSIKINPILIESSDFDNINYDYINRDYTSYDDICNNNTSNNDISNNYGGIDLKTIKSLKLLQKANGVIVPGGFGSRGANGKIFAINYVRTRKIPFLGICFGMQLAIIEYARNVLKLDDVNTTEINPNCKNKIIINMSDLDSSNMGGTQRLGAYKTILDKESKCSKIYNSLEIIERHRHRYEVNPDYVDMIENKGLKFVGKDSKLNRMEIIELDDYPFFIGTQFHPEYKSRPLSPAPLFCSFVKESLIHKNKLNFI